MVLSEPATGCFLTATRDQPVHLRDLEGVVRFITRWRYISAQH